MQEEADEIAEKDPSVASLPQDDIRKTVQAFIARITSLASL